MSGAEVVQILIALITLMGACFTAYVGLQVAKLNNKATAAEAKVEQVAVKLESTVVHQEKKLDDMSIVQQQTKETGDKIHTLVNSNMGVQLRMVAELSRWKSAQTNNQADKDAADKADKLLREHESRQAVVDAGQETG